MISWRLGWAFATLATTILLLIAGSVHYAFTYVRTRMVEIGDLQSVERIVPLRDARQVEANLVFAIGDLTLSGGASGLMEVKTSHYTPPLYTTMSYSVTEESGMLFFAHANPDVVPKFERPPEYQSQGRVKLNNNVPLSLTLTLGLHQGRLNFAGMTLSALTIAMIDGSCEIDLRDDLQNSFTVTIENGFGESVILLPADTGVRVRLVDQNESEIAMQGLTKMGDFYANDALGESPVTLDVTVEGEEGRVRLVVGP